MNPTPHMNPTIQDVALGIDRMQLICLPNPTDLLGRTQIHWKAKEKRAGIMAVKMESGVGGGASSSHLGR